MLKYILMCLLLTSCVTRTLETSFDLPDAPELKMRDVKWEVYLVDDNSFIPTSIFKFITQYARFKSLYDLSE